MSGPTFSRRAWLASTSMAAAAALVKTRHDAVELRQQAVPAPPPELGRSVSELGTRAPAEQPRRLPGPKVFSSQSHTPIHSLVLNSPSICCGVS